MAPLVYQPENGKRHPFFQVTLGNVMSMLVIIGGFVSYSGKGLFQFGQQYAELRSNDEMIKQAVGGVLKATQNNADQISHLVLVQQTDHELLTRLNLQVQDHDRQINAHTEALTMYSQDLSELHSYLENTYAWRNGRPPAVHQGIWPLPHK